MYKITSNKEKEITFEEAISENLIIGVLTDNSNKTIIIECGDNHGKGLVTFSPYSIPGLGVRWFYSYETKIELLDKYAACTPVVAFETYQEAYAWMLEE